MMIRETFSYPHADLRRCITTPQDKDRVLKQWSIRRLVGAGIKLVLIVVPSNMLHLVIAVTLYGQIQRSLS